MTITIVAALDEGRVIGRDGGLPWHLPADLKHFKATTMGHPMVMGRATFDTMGALPGRRTIVITRDRSWSAPGAEVAHSLQSALEQARDGDPDREVMVVGGAQVFEAALPLADRMVLSEVTGRHEGDTVFPSWDPQQWEERSREPREGFTVVTYERA